jgi:hypothetical protein
MSNFQLNFNTAKKVVSITLDNEDGVLDLAYLFKKILDDAGIENTINETLIEEPIITYTDSQNEN